MINRRQNAGAWDKTMTPDYVRNPRKNPPSRVVAPLRLGAREFLAGFGVGRWNIKIQCLEQCPAIISDFMTITVLDEEKRPRS
jgi:hypothetical protein